MNYVSLAEGIKTYTEQANSDLQGTLSEMLENAQHIVFLGFAYYDQNIALLTPGEDLGDKKVYGTAYGMSDSDVEVVMQQIRRWFRQDGFVAAHTQSWITIENKLKCADLFDNYAKSLTA